MTEDARNVAHATFEPAGALAAAKVKKEPWLRWLLDADDHGVGAEERFHA
jgi:hypothetical protein